MRADYPDCASSIVHEHPQELVLGLARETKRRYDVRVQNAVNRSYFIDRVLRFICVNTDPPGNSIEGLNTLEKLVLLCARDIHFLSIQTATPTIFLQCLANVQSIYIFHSCFRLELCSSVDKIYYLIRHTRSLSQLVLNMNTTTHSHENTRENLLVIDNSGRILSRRVSQVYGTGLLRAIVHSVRLQAVHHTSLLQTEPWTLENIKEDAQAVSPGDNIIFVDDSRRILSCRINPDHGIALLESLPQNPTEVADYAEAALSYNPTNQPSEASSSKQGTGAQSSQGPSTQSKPLYTDSSFPLSNKSATPTAKARILSDQVLSTINRQPYDRDWMSKYNIDDSCLNGTSSEIKLDVLFKHGAIKAGDLLGVRYELDDGSAYIEVGQVRRCCCFPGPHICSKGTFILTSLLLVFIGPTTTSRSSKPLPLSTGPTRLNPPSRHRRHLIRL